MRQANLTQPDLVASRPASGPATPNSTGPGAAFPNLEDYPPEHLAGMIRQVAEVPVLPQPEIAGPPARPRPSLGLQRPVHLNPWPCSSPRWRPIWPSKIKQTTLFKLRGPGHHPFAPGVFYWPPARGHPRALCSSTCPLSPRRYLNGLYAQAGWREREDMANFLMPLHRTSPTLTKHLPGIGAQASGAIPSSGAPGPISRDLRVVVIGFEPVCA